MDSDRVMVFDQGQLLEFDTPATLLANPTSKFYALVSASHKSFRQNIKT
jgi:ABC-type multidrug transport system fused ATPase/permease subunit